MGCGWRPAALRVNMTVSTLAPQAGSVAGGTNVTIQGSGGFGFNERHLNSFIRACFLDPTEHVLKFGLCLYHEKRQDCGTNLSVLAPATDDSTDCGLNSSPGPSARVPYSSPLASPAYQLAAMLLLPIPTCTPRSCALYPSGFNPDPTLVSVRFGGSPCLVTASSPSSITCTTGPATAFGPAVLRVTPTLVSERTAPRLQMVTHHA